MFGLWIALAALVIALVATFWPQRVKPSGDRGGQKDRAGERELKWNRDFHDRNGNQV
jgi:hypothetical protein